MRSVHRWLTVGLLALLAASPSLGTLQAQGIAWQTDLVRAKQMAAQSNRLVLVHFWATWCTWCQPLEHEVFNKPEVAQALEVNYVPVKLDFDKHRAVADKYGVRKLPWDVVITPAGEKVKDLRSPNTAQLYVAQMTQIADAARRPVGQMYASHQGTAPSTQGSVASAAVPGNAPPP